MASAALEKARQLLEEAAAESLPTEQVDALPSGFYDAFVLCGIEPGRLLCHFTVPARLLNSGNFLHGGATASLVDLVGTAVFYTAGAQTRGSPLEMNISYLDAAFSDMANQRREEIPATDLRPAPPEGMLLAGEAGASFLCMQLSPLLVEIMLRCQLPL